MRRRLPWPSLLRLALLLFGLTLAGPAAAGTARPTVWAHATSAYLPNDPGLSHHEGGWTKAQWNFAGPFGVRAPEAWGHLRAAHAAGGRGVTIAVLDSGVDRQSPDLGSTRFTEGHDFIDGKLPASDGNGHGTHVASTIAESTNNGYGMTGLAYGATIMPVRVLDDDGVADARVVASGIRFATAHGAQVINLSLGFPPGTEAKDIPSVLSAVRAANAAGVVVVVAAGNDGLNHVTFPGVSGLALTVGATTEHGCLAAYSNHGAGLDLVAPGGGVDQIAPDDPNCHRGVARELGVMQVTLKPVRAASKGLKSPRGFGIGAFSGTSMAAPHVAAAAALVIASGVLGAHPSPAAVRQRLLATARDLGSPGPDPRYGAGLLDAAAATARR